MIWVGIGFLVCAAVFLHHARHAVDVPPIGPKSSPGEQAGRHGGMVPACGSVALTFSGSGCLSPVQRPGLLPD